MFKSAFLLFYMIGLNPGYVIKRKETKFGHKNELSNMKQDKLDFINKVSECK